MEELVNNSSNEYYIIKLYKFNLIMKKVFIIKFKNLETNEIETLSSYAFKDYQTAVNTLKEKIIAVRYELMKEKYHSTTDMTEILKGFIEVYMTKKGQLYETFNIEPIKIYNYNF